MEYGSLPNVAQDGVVSMVETTGLRCQTRRGEHRRFKSYPSYLYSARLSTRLIFDGYVLSHMVDINSDSSTTTCPDCGREMGLVTYHGPKPKCARCNGTTFVEYSGDGIRKTFERNEQGCLHDMLDEHLPPSKQGGARNLACPCPKCSPRC